MDELKKMIKEAHTEVIEKWDRMLPTPDLLVDRWEKAKMLGFGEGSSVYDSCMVFGLSKLKVGKNVWIGPSAIIDGTGGLTIGDYCQIGPCTQVYSHDTLKNALSSRKQETEFAPTALGHNCHVGPGSVIFKGVTLGNHCVVGAGCVVTKSFPPYSVIMGIPGRKVGEVIIDGDDIEIKYIR